MALIVQKFGGTSVADIDRIQKVAQIVLREYKAGNRLVVVVSAMSGVTNSLINSCSTVSSLNSYDHLQEYDAVVGSGEILTSGLLALELQRIGLKARSLQGWQIPILTDDIFASAQVQAIDSVFLRNLIDQDIIPVITGFQGVTKDKQITTLGKGGSDTTAALVAAAISAERADIYTDVTGVFTADPRVVHDARKIEKISTKMMLDLSGYGAKVLHPRAALAAHRYKFDMRILSSFEDDNGTLISAKFYNETDMENRLITAIASNKNLLQIDIGFAADAFDEVIKRFADDGLIIDKIDLLEEDKMSLIANLADKNKFAVVLQSLQALAQISQYEIKSNISTVTMVGYGIKNDNGFSFKVMNLFNEAGIKFKGLDVTETRFISDLASSAKPAPTNAPATATTTAKSAPQPAAASKSTSTPKAKSWWQKLLEFVGLG